MEYEDYIKSIIGENRQMSDYFADNNSEITYFPRIRNKIDSIYFPRIRNNNETNIIKQNNINNHSFFPRQVSNTAQINNFDTYQNTEIQNYYPEIYKIVSPMVKKVVNKNNGSKITNELIDKMTQEVYDALEVENETKPSVTQIAKKSNSLLSDLLKILILNQILNNESNMQHYKSIQPRPQLPIPLPFPYSNQNRINYFNTPYPEDNNY